MRSITRDRGCLYYVPWIAACCVCLGVASLGVWIHYTRTCKNLTLDALKELDVGAKNVDRIDAALIATAITYLVIISILLIASLWRSFIEAAHDATGSAARGSLAFLIIAFLLLTCWLLMTIWLVLLTMANTVWAATLYVLRGAVSQAIHDMSEYGTATWLPSQGLPCPGQCLDLTPFKFVTAELQDSCVCDSVQLTTVYNTLNDTYDKFPAVAVGNWVMLFAAICLLVNFACQFSHNKRERELLLRIVSKVYNAA